MSTLRSSILVLAAALAGCSGMKIRTEYDPAASWAGYKTYAWLAVEPGAEQAAAIRNPQVRQRVVEAIDRGMAKKGLVLTTPEKNPDFFVSVIGWAQSRVEVTNYGYAYGGGYAYGSPYGGPVMMVPVSQAQSYTDGTLILDFVDAKTRKLVWRGTASDTVTNPESVFAVVDEAARKLLDAYPPKK